MALALPAALVRPLAAAGDLVTYAIPAADGVQIDRAREVVLARHDGVLYGFVLSCPHQNTALRWNQGSAQFYCWRVSPDPRHARRYFTSGSGYAFLSDDT